MLEELLGSQMRGPSKVDTDRSSSAGLAAAGSPGFSAFGGLELPPIGMAFSWFP